MAKITLSTKRLQISKANYTVVIAISAATFVTVFSLVAMKGLLQQRSYQQNVISQREKARDQINANIAAVDKLRKSYQQFVESPENIIGGASVGTGDKDGDNARIILDALPGQYDFPALTTSIEKLMSDSGVKLSSLTGTDDELQQSTNKESATPEPVEMPFSLSVGSNYTGVKSVIDVFERSIRPFSITKLQVASGNGDDISLTISGKTYYQPAKNLNIKSEVVK